MSRGATGQASARGPLIMGLAALFVLVAGFGVWAASARIAGAIVASGQIEVEQHRQVVQHPDGGVVAQILVRDGQPVEQGEVLIRLDGSLLQTELTIIEGQYHEVLARRGRLEAERDGRAEIRFPDPLTAAARAEPRLHGVLAGQESLFAARLLGFQQSLDQLEIQLDQLTSQIDGINAQAAAVQTQRRLIGEELADQRSLLDKGLAQMPRILALEREAAAIEGQIGELQALKAQAKARKAEIAMTRLQRQGERREQAESELRDLGYRELELAERRQALRDRIARLDITAPVAGIVHQLQITTPRAVLRPADPMLYLVPQDRPLVVAARIAAIHIDEVRPGQPVRLHLPGFNTRLTPQIEGVVARISADALTDETTRGIFYRAEIAIAAGGAGDPPLLPGMPVEIHIQTGLRSPAAYLLKPFTDYFARAMRES